jgi:hypothetical protein
MMTSLDVQTYLESYLKLYSGATLYRCFDTYNLRVIYKGYEHIIDIVNSIENPQEVLQDLYLFLEFRSKTPYDHLWSKPSV